MTFSIGAPKQSGVDIALGGLTSGIGTGLQQSLENYHQQKKLSHSAEGLQNFLASSGMDIKSDDIKGLLSLGADPKDILDFSLKLNEQNQLSEKQKENQKEDEILKNAFSNIESLIPYSGIKTIPGMKSFTGGGLNRRAIQKREQFDREGFLLADKIFTKFNKGVINKDKLKVIKNEMAPNSKLSERVNSARIDALKTMSGLPQDATNEQFDIALSEAREKLKDFQQPFYAQNERGQTLMWKNNKWVKF